MNIDIILTLEAETCCSCGITFAIPHDYQYRRKNDHESFYCPSGHMQHYFRKSQEELLRERLSEAMNRETNLSNELNRVKKRVKNGNCLYCKRNFNNLKRHMDTKHK